MPTIDNYQAPDYLKVLTGADGIETATLGKMKNCWRRGSRFWKDKPLGMKFQGRTTS